MRRVLLLAASILAICPVDAAAEWRTLRTDHFHIIGDASAGRLREVATRFEQFRDIVTRLNIASAGQEGIPSLTVFVFKDQRSFEPFMPRCGSKAG